MIISTLEVKQPRAKNPYAKYRPPTGKSRKYHVTILSIDTEVIRNTYKKATDDGFTYREPCVLVVKIKAKTWEGIPCFFNSRLEFVRATGLRKGDYYAKISSDFVSVSVSPDNSSIVYLRVREGDDLWITAIEEEKLSSKKTYYLKLSRVKIVEA